MAGATTIGGTISAMAKTIAISVDGTTRHVTTLSGTVQDVLQVAGLQLGEHDILAPAASSGIADNSRIVVKRGRVVTVVVDGTERRFWTTATTVDAAMSELGRDAADFKLSADRSREIPLTGLTLTAHTLHSVIVADRGGDQIRVRTAAGTVADLLDERGITLADDDDVTPTADTPLADGMDVAVTRVSYRTTTTEVAVAQPPSVTKNSPTLAQGRQNVTPGHPGTDRITYRTKTINGKAGQPTQIDRTTLVAAVATVTVVGTKPAPTTKAAPTTKPAPTTKSAPTTKAAPTASAGTSSGVTWVGNRAFFHDFSYGVNWDGLAKCESTNNPRAVNPSGKYTGMFQFDRPTWRSVGGTGSPGDATPEEQLVRAKKLYLARGLSPWACAWAAH